MEFSGKNPGAWRKGMHHFKAHTASPFAGEGDPSSPFLSYPEVLSESKAAGG
jgi:hypothetical protein